MKLGISFIILVNVPIVAAPLPKEKQSDQEKLSGKWECIGLQHGGRQIKPGSRFHELTFQFDKNQITIAVNFKTPQLVGTFSLDPSKSPKHIDLLYKVHEGKKILGIYELKGDVLTLITASRPEKPPPKAFSTARSTSQKMWTLRRVNK